LLSVLQRAAGIRLYGRVAVYVVGSTVVLVTVSSLAMLEAERGFPGSNINDYGQALWWAMVTMTTVGYGDKIPVSGTGHFIAVGLMIAGIALLGTVTATLASWLVQKVSEQDVASQVATKMEMAALTQEVASLGRLLQESLARGATAADPDGAGSAARRPEDPASRWPSSGNCCPQPQSAASVECSTKNLGAGKSDDFVLDLDEEEHQCHSYEVARFPQGGRCPSVNRLVPTSRLPCRNPCRRPCRAPSTPTCSRPD
jgi:hypothetical protein